MDYRCADGRDMTLLRFFKLYGVGAVVFFTLDLIWLGVVARGFYQQHLGYLMRADVRWGPALLFYLIYVAALVVFAVAPALEKQSLGRAVLLGKFFGLACIPTNGMTRNQSTAFADAVGSTCPGPVSIQSRRESGQRRRGASGRGRVSAVAARTPSRESGPTGAGLRPAKG